MSFTLSFVSYSALVGARSFPTRRSSDLDQHDALRAVRLGLQDVEQFPRAAVDDARQRNALHDAFEPRDRKSTRLNSSHLVSSYAVFCLKKKTSAHEARLALRQLSMHSPR